MRFDKVKVTLRLSLIDSALDTQQANGGPLGIVCQTTWLTLVNNYKKV
jgi:hypothetical protein